jgi:hypothetical protein
MMLTSGIIAIIIKLFQEDTGGFELFPGCGLPFIFLFLSWEYHKGLHLICIGFMHLSAALFSIILTRLFIFG